MKCKRYGRDCMELPDCQYASTYCPYRDANNSDMNIPIFDASMDMPIVDYSYEILSLKASIKELNDKMEALLELLKK